MAGHVDQEDGARHGRRSRQLGGGAEVTASAERSRAARRPSPPAVEGESRCRPGRPAARRRPVAGTGSFRWLQRGEDALDGRALGGRPAEDFLQSGRRSRAAGATARNGCPNARRPAWPACPGWPSSSTRVETAMRASQQVEHESPGVARLDHLLLGEGEMPPGGLGADVAGHQHRGGTPQAAATSSAHRRASCSARRAIRPHDAGGAQDRQPAVDAQPGIEGRGPPRGRRGWRSRRARRAGHLAAPPRRSSAAGRD